MKRLLLAWLFCGSMALSVSAQDIINEVKRMKDTYLSEANDTSKDIEERKIATFKYDATRYLIDNAGYDTEAELGNQVAAMTDFVNLFFGEIKDAKNKQKRATVMEKYKNASLSNPLYHDYDKQLVHAYINNNGFLTQFSLDTNWVVALEEVQKK